MQNFQITSSPDPPVLGEDVTMTISGALDKQITAGDFTISIKTGLFSFPLTVPFKRNVVDPSAFVAGQDTTITLGPFKYPNVNVPLLNKVSGKVEMKDQDAEQVMCSQFSLPAYSATAPAQSLGDDPFIDCGTDADHIKNRVLIVEPPTISKGVPFTVTSAGDLDEDVSSGVADIEVDLSLFKLGLSVPFAFSRAAPAGHANVTVGPMTMPSIPLIPNAKGSIKLSEQNGEEVMCYNFNVPVAELTV